MKQVFINLAVSDVNRSMELYSALGFTLNPQFSDDSGKCMVWSDTIFLMILGKEKFSSFTKRPLADTRAGIAAMFALSLDSLDAVNQLMDSGLRAGGVEPMPMQDYGFMQSRQIEDFDGHTWELFYMDLSKIPKA